ncbi:ABC-three component system middle component 1 [Flocculibacter collagenilyticus]|uniref:ABC-three component system middle component 1 n=1 Tax=Flocculibacter collagenilyticus TaxID=2744479 RepID=UPI0018F319AE|nr:ABC-three component system middle component 1 [Flocculibacter collagenilyticus]
MINKIIAELSYNSLCKFKPIEQESVDFNFYQASSIEHQRFLAVIKITKLMKPSELNKWVLDKTPKQLREQPTFAKNTDVVFLFELGHLKNIVNYEHEIFAIEEDSYSFKKHVLYYTNDEVALLSSLDIKSIVDLIKNQSKFNLYKNAPLEASEYGIASRIFIKLPFLSIPVDESELDDPCELANDYLQEEGYLELSKEFERLIDSSERCYQTIVEEYIHGKMANSQTEG